MPSIVYSSWSKNPCELWCRYSKEIPDAYERLLLDAIEGERRLFIRSDELDAAWELFTPLLKELEEKKIAPELYPYGSRGPVGAHYLAAKYNVRWGDLGSDHYRGWERDFHGLKLQNYCMYEGYMVIRFWRCTENSVMGIWRFIGTGVMDKFVVHLRCFCNLICSRRTGILITLWVISESPALLECKSPDLRKVHSIVAKWPKMCLFCNICI